ncbi:MAG: helix-turn-helix domain-containing protein [Treponema sp.]|jgi:transcriptional regulator with XRE-family HTH domain|nr:helix-turn-helix domain-containing protein [Treponema sp.]
MSEDVFGKRLRFARNDRGWSQERLAELAEIPNTSVAHFESGDRKPSYDNLRKLTLVLDISADYLLGIEDELTIALPLLYSKKLAKISGDDRVLLDQIIEILIARNWKVNLERGLL